MRSSVFTAMKMFIAGITGKRRVSADGCPDPFYSDSNMNELKRRIDNIRSGKGTLKEHVLFDENDEENPDWRKHVPVTGRGFLTTVLPYSHSFFVLWFSVTESLQLQYLIIPLPLYLIIWESSYIQISLQKK